MVCKVGAISIDFFQTFSSWYKNNLKYPFLIIYFSITVVLDKCIMLWSTFIHLLENKHISRHSVTKLNWSGSASDIFPEDKGQRVRSVYLRSARLCFLFQNAMGLWVNKSHLMIEGEVVFPFNEARKQFIWPDWPQAITLSTFLNQ